MSAVTTTMHIADVSFYREDGTTVVWDDISGDTPLPAPGGGSRDAALLIQLGVDGQHTIVHGQSADRAEIARAIEDLTYLLSQLDALYPPDQPRGRCVDHGDEGRCKLPTGHDGRHQFAYDELRNAFELGRDAERLHL